MPINVSREHIQNQLPNSIVVDALSLTKAGAMACYDWIGKGKEKDADQAAVSAMRRQFDKVNFNGVVVIGEGERDAAPMLYIGEKVGNPENPIKVDIAVDPLEGTTLCALAMPNSISVIALALSGTLLHAPDIYMDKIAVGRGLPTDVVDLDNTPAQNLKNLAQAKKCNVSNLKVCLLKRPRHDETIAKIREAGARVQLITDGDVTAAIATCLPNTGVDMYLGSGGAPEGVLASAALKCIGGFMQGRLVYKDNAERVRAKQLGLQDLDFKYTIDDMVRADVVFAATGITNGWLLDGIKVDRATSTYSSHSLVMHAASHTTSFVQSTTYI